MPLGAFRLNSLSQYIAQLASGEINWSLYDGSLDGSKVAVTSASASSKSQRIDSDRVLTVYNKSSTALEVYARVLSVSNTTVSLGTEYTVMTAPTYQNFDSVGVNILFKVSSTRFCLITPTVGGNWTGVFIDVSGTTISTTAIPEFTSTLGRTQIPTIMMLSSNRAVIAGRTGTGSAPCGATLLNIGTTTISQLSAIDVSPPGAASDKYAFQFPKVFKISSTRFALTGAIQEAAGRFTTVIFNCSGDTLTVINKTDVETGGDSGSGIVMDYDYDMPPGVWSPYMMAQGFTYKGNAIALKYEAGVTTSVPGGPGTQVENYTNSVYTTLRTQQVAFPTPDICAVLSTTDNNSSPRLWNTSLKIYKTDQTTGAMIGYPPVTVDSGSITVVGLTSAPYARRDRLDLMPMSEDRILVNYIDTMVNDATVGELKSFVIKAPTTSLTYTGPLYSVTSSAYFFNEGSSVTLTVKTLNVANTTLYWTLLNSNSQNEDLTATSGSFSLTSGTGTFNITSVADLLTEGAQNFSIQIRTGSTSGTVVAESPKIGILDTSLTPLPPTLTFISATYSDGGTTIAMPAGAQAGDIVVVVDRLASTGSLSSFRTPLTSAGASFTAHQTTSGGSTGSFLGSRISSRVLVAGELGTITNLINITTTAAHRAMAILFRPNKAITSVTYTLAGGQYTINNPSVQTVSISAEPYAAVAMAVYTANVAVSPQTSSITMNTLNASGVTTLYVKYKTYTDGEARNNFTVDMDDEGTNLLQSFYFKFN